MAKDRLDVADAGGVRSRRRSKSPSPSHRRKSKDFSPSTATAVPAPKGVAPPPPPPPPPSRRPAGVDPGVKDNDIFMLPSSDYSVLLLLTFAAVAVRLFRIYQPSSVVFDEVHFGGFATKYIKGRFFMDVHPPLAKLLITLAGWLSGFNGDFDFKEIGKDYIEPAVPYVAMRMLPALCGVALVPTIFLTLKAAGCSTASATLAAGMIIFDNALATQSRLILLDAPLVVFTALTGLAWTCFLNVHELGHQHAFTPNWWFWLSFTGLALGATASVKWVGLFTIAWVGSLTVLQLWTLLGDSANVSPATWLKHFFARLWCLVAIPVGFYMAMFAIHFTCLRNPGEGDGFMSSEFQATLNSKAMRDVAADVALGARVSIRHLNTQGGYLHSHASMYPTGSKQQQITLYPHKDENNVWLIENQTHPGGGDAGGLSGFDATDPPVWVRDGAVIKLYHLATSRRLHSHDHRPPVTEAEWQNEVSAYGHKDFPGDSNDMFRVEIVKQLSDGPAAKERLRTIQTKFRLIHTMTGCALFSHKTKLPAWGFEQQEVTCARGGTLPNSIWYVESNEHPQLGSGAEMTNYRKPGFLGKFWELQRVMWRTNAALVESHAWDSRPQSWPVMRRGINFWAKDHRQIYLIGNPLIWWSSTAAIALYALFKGIAVLRWQRGYRDYAVTHFRRFDYEVGVAVLAWAFHYFPFFLMQRQLFLHHYLPALYFAVVALAQVFDFVAFRVRAFGLSKLPVAGWSLAVVFLALSAAVYGIYSPLAYGNPWTKGQCNKVKLMDSWDWDCNNFFETYADYDKPVATSPKAAPTSATSAAAAAASDPAAAAAPAADAPKAEAPPVVPANGQQQPLKEADPAPPPVQPKQENEEAAPVRDPMITAAARMPDEVVVNTEEHVEYRDQDGNLLDPEQVKALEGKVEFETKYETRYKVVDKDGNEVEEPPAADAGPVQQDASVLDKSAVRADADAGAKEPAKAEGSAQSEAKANPGDGGAEEVVHEHVVYVDQDGNPLPEEQSKEKTVYVDEHGVPLPDEEQDHEEPKDRVEQKTVYVDEYGVPLPDDDQDEYEEATGEAADKDAPAPTTVVAAEAQTTD